MHALHALAGLNALAVEDVTAAMADGSPVVRGHGVRLAEQFCPSANPVLQEHDEDKMILGHFGSAGGTRDSFVQYQLAWTLGIG